MIYHFSIQGFTGIPSWHSRSIISEFFLLKALANDDILILVRFLNIPFAYAFNRDLQGTANWFIVISMILDILCLIDVFLNFYTGFRSKYKNQIVLDHGLIIRWVKFLIPKNGLSMNLSTEITCLALLLPIFYRLSRSMKFIVFIQSLTMATSRKLSLFILHS